MSQYVKLQANTIALSTANTVNSAQCVRITNPTAGPVLITHAYANTVQIGTAVVLSNTDVFFVKMATDTLASNATVNAVSVGFY